MEEVATVNDAAMFFFIACFAGGNYFMVSSISINTTEQKVE
jgi:hypothetical protein